MKINNIRIFHLRKKKIQSKEPLPSFFYDGFVFFKLYVNNDIYGFGEPSPYVLETKRLIKIIKKLYLSHFKDKKVSELNLTKLKNTILNKNHRKIITCFDQALKEIISKSRDLSVFDYLNKNNKKFIKMYASGGMIFEKKGYAPLLEEALKQKYLGFFGWKFRPTFPDKNLSHSERIKNPPPFNLKKLIKFAEKLRLSVGNNFELMLDCGSRCQDLKEARYLIEALKELNFYFIEEPLPRKNYLYKSLMSRIINITIASGENISSFKEFLKWKKNKVSIFQPDSNLITYEELKKIENHWKKRIVVHNWCNSINHYSNINYIFSSKRNILIEKNILQNPYSKFFKINSFVEKQGMIFKSENNKFGIKFIYPKSKLYELNEIKI